MNCDQAIELLPWLLNGTLEAGERAEVRRHLETCEPCRQALNDTREAWRIFDQHLPTQALVSLAYGERPAGIDPALAESHLASCPQCAAELELARTSHGLEEEDKVVVFPGSRSRREAGSVSRGWRAAALAAGLAGLVAGAGWFQTARQFDSMAAQRPVPAEESRPAAPIPPAGGGDASRQRIAELEGKVQEFERTQAQLQEQLQQAAGQIAQIEQQPRGLMEPQINAWSDLVGAGDVVRGGSSEEVAVIPANRPATPVLEATGENTPREIEIQDASGKTVWTASGLRRSPQDDYKVSIPAGFLKPGRYTIQLYSREGSKRVPRETYNIRVE